MIIHHPIKLETPSLYAASLAICLRKCTLIIHDQREANARKNKKRNPYFEIAPIISVFWKKLSLIPKNTVIAGIRNIKDQIKSNLWYLLEEILSFRVIYKPKIKNKNAKMIEIEIEVSNLVNIVDIKINN